MWSLYALSCLKDRCKQLQQTALEACDMATIRQNGFKDRCKQLQQMVLVSSNMSCSHCMAKLPSGQVQTVATYRSSNMSCGHYGPSCLLGQVQLVTTHGSSNMSCGHYMAQTSFRTGTRTCKNAFSCMSCGQKMARTWLKDRWHRKRWLFFCATPPLGLNRWHAFRSIGGYVFSLHMSSAPSISSFVGHEWRMYDIPRIIDLCSGQYPGSASQWRVRTGQQWGVNETMMGIGNPGAHGTQW